MECNENQYVKYDHHGWQVYVDSELKGYHREHCLCYKCSKFKPEDREGNCKIANMLYSLCVLAGITAPVWECLEFNAR